MTFRYEPDDERLGPPPPLFRIPPRTSRFGDYGRLIRLGVVLAVLLALFIAATVAKSLYTDFLWFESLGYDEVYTKRLYTRLWLFFAGAAAFLLLLLPNLWLARRSVARFTAGLGSFATPDPAMALTLRIVVGALAIFVAVIFGATLAGHWETMMLWREGRSFGVDDPEFGRDIGFYIFTLPALEVLKNWLLSALIIVLVCTGAVYALGIRHDSAGAKVPAAAKPHLSVLVAAILATFAFHHWLGLFELNLSGRGAVFGVGYADANARIPLQWALVVLAVAAAAATLAGAALRGVLVPVGVIGVWLFMGVVVTNGYPAIVQRFQVAPDEISKERQYLVRNIESTRDAFQLNDISEQTYAAESTVTAATVADNDATIRDVRLWDHRPLRDTYSQLQGLRPLYDFVDVDVDRYAFGEDGRRQVMLAARELSQARLPADASGWLNRHLQFTHGYGLVMSPVNEITPGGQPRLLIENIPIEVDPEAAAAIRIDRPEIYYGEMTDSYAIVNTREAEFDHPEGEENIYTTYEADRGVEIGGRFRRFLYAWEFADLDLLVSDAVTGESRMLYRRNVRERVAELAPFLALDGDPYLVVADGRLFWMIDAYTTSDRYPYSTPHPSGFNYIRNSVKATVDAYTGDVALYIVDGADPIILTWAEIFPELFRPIEAMAPALRDHVRYPEVLFRAQAEMYRTYHMRDPQVFYNKEDLWTIPTEKFGEQDVPVEPYYVTMRIPGEDTPEFVLIMPFSAANRANAVALLLGRSDGEQYGETLALRFPTSDLVPGPRQIEARIDQDPRVSEQLTLWNQAGSQVIRGNLLMVPIGESYLYIEPIYLQASTLAFPELRRVVVVANDQVAMEPTLDAALAVIFGERAPTTPLPDGAVPPDGETPAATPTVSPGDASATPAAAPHDTLRRHRRAHEAGLGGLRSGAGAAARGRPRGLPA